jgi:hypothetical protein
LSGNFIKKTGKFYLKMAKEVVISNSTLNSYKFRILTSGIDISQFQRNPILLWCHNRPWRGTTDEVLPIGRVENLRIDGDNLIGTPVFDEKDDFAKKIKLKWDRDMLRMVSAGLDPIEMSDDPSVLVTGQTRPTITRCRLREVSIVDIGANDDALALYNEKGLIELSAGGMDLILPEIALKDDLNNNVKKNMKTIAVKLGLPETATEAEILAEIGVVQLSAKKAESLQEEMDRQRDQAITDEVDAAIRLKRVSGDKREHFVEIGKKAGLASLRETLELMSPVVRPTDLIHGGKPAGAANDWKKLSEVPSEEAIRLRSEEPDTYKKLYRAEYGFECEI